MAQGGDPRAAKALEKAMARAEANKKDEGVAYEPFNPPELAKVRPPALEGGDGATLRSVEAPTPLHRK